MKPLISRIEARVFAAARLHGDDTAVPVLAKGKTDLGRCWIYVRDDRPFGGSDLPPAMFYCSRDRGGEHPRQHLADSAGIFRADAFSGYTKLYLPERKPTPILCLSPVSYASCSSTQLITPSPSLRPLGVRSSQLKAPISSSAPR